MKLLSLFSGIGAFEVALNEENIDWSLDHYCEIDKYACQSYNMIHGTTDDDNLKDVTNIDYSKVGEIDLLTYGFPCQDISLAGEQKGFVDEDGNITRSGLFFNAADVIRHTKPKFAIFENVKNLVSKKFKNEFDAVLTTLDDLGYNTYWKVLNSKNFGIPQNRERVFGISIRKDIDKGFEFPEEIPLMLRLKDMLEDNVDEKYFLKDEKIKKIKSSNFQQEKKMIQEGNICSTLLARDYKDPKCVPVEDAKIQQIGNIVSTGNWDNPQRGRIYSADGLSPSLNTVGGGGLEPKILQECVPVEDMHSNRLGGVFDDEKGKHQAGSVWDANKLSPTLDTMQGGYRQPCIIVPEKTKRGYKEAYDGDGIYINRPHQKRDCVQHEMVSTLKTTCGNDLGVVVEQPTIIGSTQKNASVRKDGISPTLTEAMGMGGGHVPMVCNDDAVIKKQDIIFPVRVRKYPVDCKALCSCLRSYKGTFTNKEIATRLGVPLTKVEHWFRNDDSFAIPDENVWFELKDLLGIETTEFDKSIMTFETKDNVFEKANRCYEVDGIAPTLTATSAAEKIIESNIPVNDLDGVCKTVRAGGRGSVDRHSWDLVEDNTDIEKAMLSDKGKNFVLSPKRGMCTDVNADVCQTLTAKGQTNWTGSFVSPDIDKIEKSSTIGSTKPVDIYLKNGEKTTSEDTETISRLRIRKLTPRECWRLMGFGDKYFDRVEGVSNTQLYKQAGNSIVVDVLRAIFRCFKEQYPEYFEDIWEDDL